MKLAPAGHLGHHVRFAGVLIRSASGSLDRFRLRAFHQENPVRSFSSRKMVETKDHNTVLASMRSRVQEQGDIVRALKSRNAPDSELKIALAELKARKKLLEEKEAELLPMAPGFDRNKLEDLLKQKFFYDQSFAIYGGIQGLYDYGPMGCAMKANLIAAWRQHFILEDQLLEVDCSMLTPAPVLQASGHVERFTDLMVKDMKTGECFRADHLVKANLEAKQKHKKTSEAEKQEIQKLLTQLDNFGSKELDDIIRRYDMKAPTTNNELSEPQEFNLMFSTVIGPTGQCKGYLRPETAQGIFVNFQRLLQFNQGKIPFGAAQIGSAFRNEISPRSGLIRVREFAMAEIEYFVDPKNKQHPKFDRVHDVTMTLYSACDQMDGNAFRKMTIGDAVEQGIVANQTLGYFMARIHQFLLLIGVDPNRLRFRQHLSNEMAHYACDCWDAECQTSYGWVECVGCADRSCFDLTQHARATGTRLVAEKQLTEPRLVRVCECVPDKQALGKTYRGAARSLIERLSALTLDEALQIKTDLDTDGEAVVLVDGKPFIVDNSMVKMKDYESKVHVDEIVPNVIEPSFGLGRILYALFEHSFRVREGDEQRTYLSVPPLLAPYKCSVLPLSSHPDFGPFIRQLSDALTRVGVTHRIDESSGSIGRRYARTDQIAIPYGITIDFDTLNKSPASATLRERDSMKQIRVPILELPALVSELSNGLLDWTEAQAKYPAFEQQETVQREDSIPNQFVKEESKSPPISPQIQDVVDSNASPILAARVDDWQSVSEDVESEEEKQRPTLQSVPLGPQLVASEDLTTSADSVPIQGRVTPVAGKVSPVSYQPKDEFVDENSLTKSNEKRGHKHGHTYKSDEVDISPTKNEISVVPLEEVHGMGTKISSGAKLPSTWADCAKAIRRHYQEEESREKQTEQAASVHKDTTAPAISPLEMEESRNSYSGYEADQEDNVVNKSTTFDQMSPMIPYSAEAPGETDFGSSAGTSLTEATVPSKPELPNHGLFIGDGWPGQKRAAVTQGSREKQHERDAPASSSGWETTMSQVYEKTCEPEMWQMQLDHADQSMGLTQISYDPRAHPPVQMPLVGAESRPDETSASHTTRFDSSVNHGLFVGSGWPATKQPTASLEAKKKPDASKDKELDTEQSIEQPPSPRKPSTVPERERFVSPQDTTVEQKPTTPTVPPSTIEFDDPLFGDFNNPSPGDMWEPAPENTTTILHTEPAPEPFWEPTDEKKNYVEADLGHAAPTEQQHVSSAQAAEDAGIFDLSISASNMDTGMVESPSEEQTYPQIVPISGEQCVTNHMDASFEPTEPVHDKTESSQLSTEAKIKPTEETVEKPKSPKMVTSEPTQHVPHENGTSKSKNKRRRHRKKKTLS